MYRFNSREAARLRRSRLKMGRLTNETRMRVILLWKSGLSFGRIQKRFQKESTTVSVVALCRLTKKVEQTNSVLDHRTYKPPRTLIEEHLRFSNESMAGNPELTGTQLILREQFSSLKPTSTVKRVQRELGWISKRTCYCALISEANRAKRVKWCKERQI